jgi:uncharacterized membrane protein YccC
MYELGIDGGEMVRPRRATRRLRLRRPLMLLAVTLLCGVAYLAGIWSGMQGGMTCVVSSPDVIVCGSDADAPPPVQATVPSKLSGSA